MGRITLVSLRFLLVPAVCLAALTAATPPAAAAAGWSPPVDGPVVRAFDPPASPYGAGHRGIDFAAPPGTPVRAAGPGTVAFAGTVAGSVHVVVAHPGGLRTTYSFLQRARVRRGDPVDARTVVGDAGGAPGHVGVVHLGLRRGDTYLDPAVLFAPPDLTEVVHLAPDADPPRPDPTGVERDAIVAALLADDGGGIVGGLSGFVESAAGWVAGVPGDAVSALQTVVGAVAGAVGPIAEIIAQVAGQVPGLLHDLVRLDPVMVGNGMLFDIGRALADWVGSRDECDPAAPAADGSGGSAHRVMVVAGIDSHMSEGGSSLPQLPTDMLGYDAADVTHYSYAAGASSASSPADPSGTGGAYDRHDTYIPIEEAAQRLGDQLRDLQRAEPGREVDLLAHSQGGVVVVAFLQLVYDPADPGYPPLGTVVTLSSPLDGAPLAGAARLVATSAPGRALLDELASAGSLPDPDAPSLADLTEGSDLLHDIHAAPLPDQVDLTTVGAALDYMVPASHASMDGATSVIVNPVSGDAHGAVLSDPAALSAVRSALEGQAPPCVSFATALAGAVVPTVIGRIEHAAGVAGAVAGAVWPDA